MDLFLVKVLAMLAVILLVGKRAMVGPQVMFARVSVAMAVFGVCFLLLATGKGDFFATVGAILLLFGHLLVIGMIVVDCAYMIRRNVGKKSG